MMKIVMSDNAPGAPTITHHSLESLQVCAPPDWTPQQIEDFANSNWKPVHNYRWAITPGAYARLNIPHSCDFQQSLIHHTLQLEPASSPTNTASKNSDRTSPETRARVIINLEGTTTESILATAHSFDLLAKYLRLKATPVHETEAEQLQNQILGQFPGTIVFL